jgi:hypothetical protein
MGDKDVEAASALLGAGVAALQEARSADADECEELIAAAGRRVRAAEEAVAALPPGARVRREFLVRLEALHVELRELVEGAPAAAAYAEDGRAPPPPDFGRLLDALALGAAPAEEPAAPMAGARRTVKVVRPGQAAAAAGGAALAPPRRAPPPPRVEVGAGSHGSAGSTEARPDGGGGAAVAAAAGSDSDTDSITSPGARPGAAGGGAPAAASGAARAARAAPPPAAASAAAAAAAEPEGGGEHAPPGGA